jgi:hypothetical protein
VSNFYSGNAVAYCGLFPAGTTFHISVKVLSGNKIDFLVADESGVEENRTRISL